MVQHFRANFELSGFGSPGEALVVSWCCAAARRALLSLQTDSVPCCLMIYIEDDAWEGWEWRGRRSSTNIVPCSLKSLDTPTTTAV